MLQVKANRFLCQLICIATFACGQFVEFGFLFGSASMVASLGNWLFAGNKERTGSA
jgi:hypothetical protein